MTNIQFTKDWWLRCINDDAKMTKWLQKLQRTELGGYTDHIEYMANNLQYTLREETILTNIAHDELKHSGLLIMLMNERNIKIEPVGIDSTYWKNILAGVSNFKEYCGANYYGESLAAFRFEVIESMPETPSDIREVIRKVLPDEIFHRETLQRLAGEETLVKMKIIHETAYNELTGLK
jgi:hypothetical protein